ncbi:hypothetical protein GF362_02430 [Candidatus Dojkabacteria bacterium]|nr:hypothetical protein [Candidatus Dojkabacteria bacterium]
MKARNVLSVKNEEKKTNYLPFVILVVIVIIGATIGLIIQSRDVGEEKTEASTEAIYPWTDNGPTAGWNNENSGEILVCNKGYCWIWNDVGTDDPNYGWAEYGKVYKISELPEWNREIPLPDGTTDFGVFPFSADEQSGTITSSPTPTGYSRTEYLADLDYDGIVGIKDFSKFIICYKKGDCPEIDYNGNSLYLKDIGDFVAYAPYYIQESKLGPISGTIGGSTTPTAPVEPDFDIYPWSIDGLTAGWSSTRTVTVCNGEICWIWNDVAASDPNYGWAEDGEPVILSEHELWEDIKPYNGSSYNNYYPWTDGGPTAAWRWQRTEDSYEEVWVCNKEICWIWNNVSTSNPDYGWTSITGDTKGEAVNISQLDFFTNNLQGVDGIFLWNGGPTAAWQGKTNHTLSICNGEYCWQWDNDWDGGTAGWNSNGDGLKISTSGWWNKEISRGAEYPVDEEFGVEAYCPPNTYLSDDKTTCQELSGGGTITPSETPTDTSLAIQGFSTIINHPYVSGVELRHLAVKDDAMYLRDKNSGTWDEWNLSSSSWFDGAGTGDIQGFNVIIDHPYVDGVEIRHHVIKDNQIYHRDRKNATWDDEWTQGSSTWFDGAGSGDIQGFAIIMDHPYDPDVQTRHLVIRNGTLYRKDKVSDTWGNWEQGAADWFNGTGTGEIQGFNVMIDFPSGVEIRHQLVRNGKLYYKDRTSGTWGDWTEETGWLDGIKVAIPPQTEPYYDGSIYGWVLADPGENCIQACGRFDLDCSTNNWNDANCSILDQLVSCKTPNMCTSLDDDGAPFMSNTDRTCYSRSSSKTQDCQESDSGARRLCGCVVNSGITATTTTSPTVTVTSTATSTPVTTDNLALNKPISDISGDIHNLSPSYSKPNDWLEMNDGDIGTAWSVNTDGTTSANKTRATIDLENYYDIDNIKYKVKWDNRENLYGTGAKITIYGSTDNNNWIVLDVEEVERNQLVDLDVFASAIRYIKFEWTDNIGGSANWNGWGGIYELEAYGTESPGQKLTVDEVTVHEGDVLELYGSHSKPEDWLDMIDGVYKTGWKTFTDGHPSVQRWSQNAIGVIKLTSSSTLNAIRYKVSWDTDSGYGTKARIRISVSEDQSSWTEIDTSVVNRKAIQTIPVSSSNSYSYVKIEWLDCSDISGGSCPYGWNGWGNIYELEVFGEE